MASGFTWRDGERTIRFGAGAVAEAVETLGGEGYALLTTERAAAMAPAVVEGAGAVHMVGAGRVDELAGDLLGAVARERIVALGGGRVVDTAKALAAASGGSQVAMAVPTTLSGAEMTRIHRQGPRRRPAAPRTCARASWSTTPRCRPRSRSPSSRPARSTRSATRPRGRARRSPTRWRRSPPTTAPA